MRSDHPQAAPLDYDFSAGRAARLDGRQIQRLARYDVDPAADEQRIAMPADAARPPRHLDHTPARIVDIGTRQHAGALADAPVRFLQRNDVGIDLVEDGQDAFGVAPAVEPDALVDVVAGESKLHRIRGTRGSSS